MKISNTSFAFIFSLISMITIFPQNSKANNLLPSIGPIIQMKGHLEDSLFNGLGDFQVNFISPIPEKVVDMKSLRVIYLKFINIDITEKIRPYIRDNSIVVPKTSLPEGNHKIKFMIKDNHKNESEQTFLIRVPNQKSYR